MAPPPASPQGARSAAGAALAPEDADPEPGTLRQQRKRATRAAIHEAALSLCEERGLDGTTAESIAVRAEVGLRTFFRYFPSKTAAILNSDAQLALRLSEELERRPSGESVVGALYQVLVSTFIEDEVSTADLSRRFRLLDRDFRLAAFMQSQIVGAEDALAEALVLRWPDYSRFECKVLAATAMTAMRLALQEWSRSGTELADLLSRAFDVIDTPTP